MGQSSSIPTNTGTENQIANATQTPQHKHKKVETLKIPSAWKNNDSNNNFVMISPQSDISNPSHFRGRKHSNPLIHAGTTGNKSSLELFGNNPNENINSTSNLMDSAKQHKRAYRTSKVCSKVQPPLNVMNGSNGNKIAQNHIPSNAIPMPSRFYFQGHDKQDDDDKEDERSNQNNIVKRPVPQYHHATVRGPKNKDTLSRKFSKKCVKAREHLSKCWKEHAGDEEMKVRKPSQPPHVVRHYSQREQIATTSERHRETSFLQNKDPFEPVWKESQQTMVVSNETRKSISSDRIKEISSNELPDRSEQKNPIIETMQQSLLPKSSDAAPTAGHVRDIIRTFSNDTSTSTAIQTKGSYTTTSTKGSSAVATVIQIKPTHDVSNSIFRTESTRVPIKVDNHVLCQSTSTSTSSSDISSKNHRKKRASIEKHRKTSDSSKQDVKDLTRRSEISLQVQRQIDEQMITALDPDSTKVQQPSRVQRLRQQYQQEIEKKFQIVQEEKQRALPSSLPVNKENGKTSDRFSIPQEISKFSSDVAQVHNKNEGTSMSVAEKCRAFENNSIPIKPRYSSVPSRVSSQYNISTNQKVERTISNVKLGVPSSSATNQANKKRSVSVPRAAQAGRPSVDGSALLLLTGSWDGATKIKSFSTTSQKMPVLLHMAGWKQQQPVATSKENNRLSVDDRRSLRLSKSNNPINMQIDKENIQSNVGQNKLQPKLRTTISENVRHSTQSEPTITEKPSREERKSSAVLQDSKPTRKAGSLDQFVAPKSFEHRSIPVARKGRTIAFMLQQAYFADDDEDETNSDGNERRQGGYLDHLMSPDAKLSSVGNNALVESSPAISIASASTTTSIPVVSDQALCNADFLFCQDGYNHNLLNNECNIENGNGLILSTMESRSRTVVSLSSVKSLPTITPKDPSFERAIISYQYDDHDVKSTDESLVSMSRRVRFSEEVDTEKNISAAPAIESKLSDLTDNTSLKRESSVSERTSMSIPRIDSIPEEDDDDEQASTGSRRKTPTKKSPIMRWSYRTTGSSSDFNQEQQGVTPLLGGKNASSTTWKKNNLTTNSPYRRFMQAKEKFITGKIVSPATKIKPVPLKRNSPTKSTAVNIVTSRIAAMEGRRFTRCNSVESDVSTLKSATSQPKKNKLSQHTTLSDAHIAFVLKPSLSDIDAISLPNSAPAPTIIPQNSIDEEDRTEIQQAPVEVTSSPMLVDGQVIDRTSLLTANATVIPNYLQNSIRHFDDAASIVSNDSEDVFGAILHPTTIDDSDAEENPNSTTDDFTSDGDEFDRLLNYTESEDEPSIDQASIAATVLQSKNRQLVRNSLPSLGLEGRHLHIEQWNKGSDTKSVGSFASSTGDTASVPHWLLQHGGNHRRSSIATMTDSSSVMSAVGRMKNIQGAQKSPFRDVAPVKPSEQPPMNQNQMVEPPRTWRALAAAAQEKDRHYQYKKKITDRVVPQSRYLSDRSNLQQRN